MINHSGIPASTAGEDWKARLLSRVKVCLKSPSGVVNHKGESIGYRRKDGYWLLSYGGKHILAHRAVYELVYGPIPNGLVIDHIDRNPSNNNPANLRAVTQSVNLGNVPVRPHCQSGHKYINMDKRTGRFSVRIKRASHGTFKILDEAIAKRDSILN